MDTLLQRTFQYLETLSNDLVDLYEEFDRVQANDVNGQIEIHKKIREKMQDIERTEKLLQSLQGASNGRIRNFHFSVFNLNGLHHAKRPAACFEQW